MNGSPILWSQSFKCKRAEKGRWEALRAKLGAGPVGIRSRSRPEGESRYHRWDYRAWWTPDWTSKAKVSTVQRKVTCLSYLKQNTLTQTLAPNLWLWLWSLSLSVTFVVLAGDDSMLTFATTLLKLNNSAIRETLLRHMLFFHTLWLWDLLLWISGGVPEIYSLETQQGELGWLIFTSLMTLETEQHFTLNS